MIKHRKIHLLPDFRALITPEAIGIIEGKIAGVADELWYENANDAQRISDLFNVAGTEEGQRFWNTVHGMCTVLPLDGDDAKQHALASIDRQIAALEESKIALESPE